LPNLPQRCLATGKHFLWRRCGHWGLSSPMIRNQTRGVAGNSPIASRSVSKVSNTAASLVIDLSFLSFNSCASSPISHRGRRRLGHRSLRGGLNLRCLGLNVGVRSATAGFFMESEPRHSGVPILRERVAPPSTDGARGLISLFWRFAV
jgi:hypothetical protein